MFGFLKRLFCRHDYHFARNLYGDQIIEWGWKRSVWQCKKCGALQGRDELASITKEGAQP